MGTDIHIQLDLSKHCIETALKKAYNQALSTYFNKKTDKKYTEQVISLTQFALEHFDFPKLRSKYRDLAGETQHQAILFKDNDKYAISLDGLIIDPIMKT